MARSSEKISGPVRFVINTFIITLITILSCIIAGWMLGLPLRISTVVRTVSFLVLVRSLSSFLLLRDYSLSWSKATAYTFLIKTAVNLTAAIISMPLLLYAIGELSFRFLAAELVIFLLLINTSVYLYYFLYNYKKLKKNQTLVIYGAGVGGIMLKDEFRDSDYRILCFIDDKEKLQGRSIDGIRVLSKDKFIKLTQNPDTEFFRKPDLLVIAMPSVPMERVKQIFREMQPFAKETKILPALNELFYSKPFTSQLRAFSLEELLARPPKDLDKDKIYKFLKGKKVLVTGAGGSIGSEICRQCIGYEVSEIILADHSEFSLYTISEELKRTENVSEKKTSVIPVLISVTSRDSLKRLFEKHRPQIVIHAAAYKHVPLVEENIKESLRNNIEGTIHTIETADEYGAERFVLISTDKAVRPSSVMGASKRICELYAQNYIPESPMEIVSVRFGNVLGSSGSVVPLFREQIEKGGPVTVTHPEITRYFMLIPEACELVLQAAAIAKGGEIFVLDMGEPVKIKDLAEKMIELSGKRGIEIKYCGLRPGEKLYEELQINEGDIRTQFESIWISGKTVYEIDKLRKDIHELMNAQNESDILMHLKKIVPEFMHNPGNEIRK